MDNGINILAHAIGRFETKDRKEFRTLTLRPSKEAVKEIERLEELALTADQRLGTFIVG